MESDTWVQILGKAVCISNCASKFKKGNNQTILPPAMGKW